MAQTAFIIDQSDLVRYRAVMKQFKKNVMAPKEFLMAAGEILMTEVDQAFKMERDPQTGLPWKDLAESTKAGRTKGSRKVGAFGRHAFGRGVFTGGKNKGKSWSQTYKILQDRGRLRGSFVRAYSMVPPAVAVGSHLPYAPAHQEESKDGTRPQRRMLPEELNPRIRAKLMRALIAQIRAGVVGQYMGRA